MRKLLVFISAMTLPLLNYAQAAAESPASNSLSPNSILALTGGIIIAGFLGNLIFKVTKIPAVVKLMGIGLLIGPVFQVVDGEGLQAVAPLVGKIALLIILFAGGLGLNLKTVIAQLGKAVLLAIAAFLVTMALSVPIAMYVIGLPVLQSIILGTLVSGTASAIVIPVIERLSAGEELKTLISIESAISNLLILVIVVIACDFSLDSNDSNFGGLFLSFLLKIFSSIGFAVVAGVLWGWVIGSLREDALSYMLTLGFIFLLNYGVDQAGGSGPISTLFFGVILSNLSMVAETVGPSLRRQLGIRVDSTKYILNEFLKGISRELSFLVGTFFFVYLGVLVSFDDFTSDMVLTLGLLIAAIVVGRLLTVLLFNKFGRQGWRFAEILIAVGMMPRGLATAVMAFKPQEAQYDIEMTEMFPFYAMIAILGSNLIMTGFVAVGEAKMKHLKPAEGADNTAEEESSEEAGGQVEPSGKEAGTPAEEPVLEKDDGEITSLAEVAASYSMERTDTREVPHDEDEDTRTFTERVRDWLGVKAGALETMQQRAANALRHRNLYYWLLVTITVVISTLALLKGQDHLLLAAVLFSPVVRLVHSMALSVARGNVYMFLKGISKITIMIGFSVAIAALVVWTFPYLGTSEQVEELRNPTVLDFVISFAAGMAMPVLLLRDKDLEKVALVPIVGLMIFPPLAAVGYGISTVSHHDLIGGGLLAFSSNFIAIILGAILVQFVMGVAQMPNSEWLKRWKEREVEEGIFHGIFERLRLTRILEYAGNVYARVIVVGLLAIALFVPLQITIKRLEKDYIENENHNRISLQIEEGVHAWFDRGDSSSVYDMRTSFTENSVISNVSVMTEVHYSDLSIIRLERQLGEKVGMPVKLRVWQNESVIDRDDSQLSGSETGSLGSGLAHIQDDVRSLRTASMERLGMQVIGFQSRFGMRGEAPIVQVDYTRSGALSADAALILKEELSELLHVPAIRIRLRYVPDYFPGNPDEINSFRDTTGHFHVLEVMQEFPDLRVLICLPSDLEKDSVQSMAARIRGLNPALADTVRVRTIQTRGDSLGIRLY